MSRSSIWKTCVARLGGMLLAVWPALLTCGQQPAPAAGGPAPSAGPAFPGSDIFNGTQAFLSNVSVDHPDRTYREGDRLSVRFKAEREAFLYLLYHQADGSTLLLFPNSARPDNRVAAGQDINLADAGDRFRIRIRPPLGDEVLQLIARQQPLDELDVLTKVQGTPVVSPQSLAKVRDTLLKDRTNWSEHRLPIKTVPAAEPPRIHEPALFALLVAADRCQDANVAPPHEQFANAPLLLGRALADRARLERERVKVLVGDQATRANIQDGITNWLATATAPGDVLVISFTGYAGEFSVSGPDGKPSTELFLMPHDNAFATPPQTREQAEGMFRERMIFETTWMRWVQALPGRKIIVVLDLWRSGLPTHGSQPAGSGPLPPASMARLVNVPHTEMALVLTWSLPQPAYFSTGERPASWTAFWLADSLQSLPAPVSLGQAFQHLRTNWMSKFPDPANATVAPLLIQNEDGVKNLQLVPASTSTPASYNGAKP